VPRVTLTIRYLNAGDVNVYGDVCVGWPENAKAAFTYAANIWGSLLYSPVPISINACWANMGGDSLGHGGFNTAFRNFPGAPQANAWYPVAVANALVGYDLTPSDDEITIAYNANWNWYFGTDGQCPISSMDFATVILHEMTHGLGFCGSMAVQGIRAGWGSNGDPYIYDRSAINGSWQSLINTALFANPSAALRAQLTGGDVYFAGLNASLANGGVPVKLYAPSTWSDGSSYSHLDYATYRNTANGLMVYALPDGTAIHNPGTITLGLLKDGGWTSADLAPMPGLAVNGAALSAVLGAQLQPVTVAVSMNAAGSVGVPKDWWLAASTSFGWYYYQAASQAWIPAPSMDEVRPAYQGGLSSLASTVVLSQSSLPAGSYQFYFGVDTMNGVVDPDVIYVTSRLVIP